MSTTSVYTPLIFDFISASVISIFATIVLSYTIYTIFEIYYTCINKREYRQDISIPEEIVDELLIGCDRIQELDLSVIFFKCTGFIIIILILLALIVDSFTWDIASYEVLIYFFIMIEIYSLLIVLYTRLLLNQLVKLQ